MSDLKEKYKDNIDNNRILPFIELAAFIIIKWQR